MGLASPPQIHPTPQSGSLPGPPPLPFPGWQITDDRPAFMLPTSGQKQCMKRRATITQSSLESSFLVIFTDRGYIVVDVHTHPSINVDLLLCSFRLFHPITQSPNHLKKIRSCFRLVSNCFLTAFLHKYNVSKSPNSPCLPSPPQILPPPPPA